MTVTKKIPIELIDTLLSGYEKPEDLLGENGLLQQLSKALIERAWEAEMAEHLRHAKHRPKTHLPQNIRNRTNQNKFKGDAGDLSKQIHRDCHDSFEPKVIAKQLSRRTGLADKIISLHTRGMTVQEIQSHLEGLIAAEVPLSTISPVTNAFDNEVKTWLSRPLEPIYPIVHFDCIHVKVRDTRRVLRKAVYLAIGTNLAGEPDVLGLWIAQNDDAESCLPVITDLKNRGVRDIFIACTDGLRGFPVAIETVYPQTAVQPSFVHLMRDSLKTVDLKMRKQVCSDLKQIYRSATLAEAEQMLANIKEKWKPAYPTIFQIWCNYWSGLALFFSYPPEIRRIIYRADATESVNLSIRNITKNRGSFSSDEALSKLFYLVLMNNRSKWNMPIDDWHTALNQFSVQFQGRMPNHCPPSGHPQT